MLDLRKVFGWEPDLELKESEYRRPARIQAGALPMEEQSGVGEVFLASPAPSWTSRSPSHEGYWWCRARGHPARIAEVFRGKNRKLWMRLNDDNVFALPQEGIQWADRAIQEPKD